MKSEASNTNIKHIVAPRLDLPNAHGIPLSSARIRQSPEDFQVEELLGFEPESEGEHLWLWLEKCLVNTDQVARQLARIAGVRLSEVGYAGLKDRNAVTRQWFSICLPKAGMDRVTQWETAQWRVLRAVRGRRKIRRGGLKGNRFFITLRELNGDKHLIEARLKNIMKLGVPNYFGEQRFGRDNIEFAEAMARGELRVPDRHLRGIYLSSLRSALFNTVLARRVRNNIWNMALKGEALNLNGSRSFFVEDDIDLTVLQRLAIGDIHPTGPLWGRGEPQSRFEARALELSCIEACPEIWKQSCIDAGMRQERRPLRINVQGMEWHWLSDHALQLEFSLPAGAYATMVLREIVEYRYS